MVFEINGIEETLALGDAIGAILRPGDIITLDGDLGAGKTTLTQGMAKALGIDDYVTSPTFTIMNVYEGKHVVYHFDAYRIEELEELDAIGFEEFIYGDGISIIEWASMIKDAIEGETLVIEILRDESDLSRRSVRISGEESRLLEIKNVYEGMKK